MIDVKAYLKYLLRFKWVLGLVPIVSVLITAYFVKDMPQKYKSTAQLSTGLTDESKQTVNPGQNMDYFKVSQQFGNIMEMMKMKRVISGLSTKLMIHDLTDKATAFHPWSDIISELTDAQRKEALVKYQDILSKNGVLSAADNKELPLYNLTVSMGYDEESLLKNLEINRSGESDFINVSFTSTNPDLSAYVANTLSNDFIVYYMSSSSLNQRASLTLLDSVLKVKEAMMNQKNAALKNYKIGSGVLNLDKQSSMIYQQISEYEARRAQSVNQIQSLQGALADINRKLSKGEGSYVGGNHVVANNEIVNLENQLQLANQRYINNNFRPEDKRAVDSLSRLRTAKLAAVAEGSIGDPASVKQNLLDQKLKLETDLSMAKNGISSLDAELRILRSKYSVLVPTDANVQNLERDADVATKEYMDALNNYNQSSLQSTTSLRLSIAQVGLLGTPERSKGILYVALSGISSFFVCLLAITLAFLLDRSIKSPKQLETITNSKVLGLLNFIDEDNKDLRDIWEDEDNVKDYSIYKDLLRSLRFELNQQVDDKENVLAITSLDKGHGKSFLASSLAYAFAMMGKKVLLICENSPGLTEIIQNANQKTAHQKFESFLVKKEIQVADRITVLNRNPNNNSLLEMRDAQSLFVGFNILKDTFDLIIMDIDPIKQSNKVKEWLMFADKSIAVFKSGQKVNEEEKEQMAVFSQHKSFIGWVFNQVKGDYTVTTG
ncbi:hypothetical protein GCM10023231_03110 [Olivibacter ginsenosidimutans]|uniref:Lipopolysaccharide biosynthesis protein n=1 Tax=Olivibacter ginsenosidimutans TaxID=1176537 RepID=A0ABP9AEG0_9SPHI